VEFTEEEVTQLVKFYDRNQTGKIPYEEFLNNLMD
jgi:Ca2+-binding EF-hand superfamily protein